MRAAGGDKKSGPPKVADPIEDTGDARAKAADEFGINPHYVSDAKAIREHGQSCTFNPLNLPGNPIFGIFPDYGVSRGAARTTPHRPSGQARSGPHYP